MYFHFFYSSRQIALKALSERLSKSDQTQWPSLVDDDSSSKMTRTVTFATKSGSSSSTVVGTIDQIPPSIPGMHGTPTSPTGGKESEV